MRMNFDLNSTLDMYINGLRLLASGRQKNWN